MNIQTNRILQRLEELGNISDDKDCLSRFYDTPAHQKAGKVLTSWMQMAGMTVTKDAIGNIRGILSSTSDAKHFVIGSHYDTVFNAGKYDGPLGILMGIEMAQRITDNNIQLPFHLNIVAFADEEGSRFNTAYLGSSVLAGNFDSNWLNRKDDQNITLRELIINNCFDPKDIEKGAIPKEDWLGYFEAHIEQGPVLEDQEVPLCVVSSIAAQTRVNVSWTGISGHAGTSPMDLRSDALCAAAEFALAVEEIGKEHINKLVATIGKFNVSPNTSNVIPGLVHHTLDIRSTDDAFLQTIAKSLEEKGKEIASKREITFNWQLMQSNPSVACDTELKQLLEKSIEKTKTPRIEEISSGAGHDAVIIAKVAPISMLFMRSKGGISHNPDEYTSAEDINAALLVCNQFMDELIQTNKNV